MIDIYDYGHCHDCTEAEYLETSGADVYVEYDDDADVYEEY